MEKKKAPLEPLFDKIDDGLHFLVDKLALPIMALLVIGFIILQISVFFVGHSTGEELCTGYFCN